MDSFKTFLDLFLHLDKSLGSVIQQYGVMTYGILFVIILCETGLVVTPFLPGDSLLFAAGAFAGTGALDIIWLYPLLLAAAILGDTINYAVGRAIGPKIFSQERLGPFKIKKEYLERTQSFYAKYGKKTIVIARFMPILRTFAPFVAGVGQMHYPHFFAYNVLGAFLWVTIFLLGGHFFGSIPFVQKNFSAIVLAIIVLSILFAALEFFRSHASEEKKHPAA